MNSYLLRIYDQEIKTNYIERLIEGNTKLDAIDKAIKDDDIKREINLKLSSKLSIEQLIDKGMYTLNKT